MFKRSMSTPLGPLVLEVEDGYLTQAQFSEEDPGESDDDPVLVQAEAQLRQYFKGELEEFDLPLRPHGTDFDQKVWTELKEVPYGRTSTYGFLANKLENPGAIRAVGRANGRNPLAIIVPCHRIIGSDGKLTGYAGGLRRKHWLLQHEQSKRGGVQGNLFG